MPEAIVLNIFKTEYNLGEDCGSEKDKKKTT